jgi:hypothetical protein
LGALPRAQPISPSQRKQNEASLFAHGNLSIPEKTALSFYGFSCLLGIILAKASHIVRELGLNWLSLFAAAIPLIIHLEQALLDSPAQRPRLISQFFLSSTARRVLRPK